MTSLIPSDNPRSPISMVLPVIPLTLAIAPVSFRCWSISVAKNGLPSVLSITT